MNPKLVREYINFDREGTPFQRLGIGERDRVLKLLDEVANDIQFQKDEPEYMGFLNTAEDFFLEQQDQEAYRIFVKKWPEFLSDLKDRGLYLADPPEEDETVFYDNSILGQNISVITPEDLKESLDFERGKDPKKSIRIGRLANAQWDYNEFSKDEIKEEYIYKGWPIRIIHKYFGNNPYGEYAGISERGVTHFSNSRLKWYKRMGYAKKWIEGIIDEIEWIRSLKNKTNESLEFERGKDPKDAMDIGRKALLRKQAEAIQWDWYPDPEDHEEIIDIIHYPQPEDQNLYIKLSKLTDEEGNSVYRTVNNYGDPYTFDPQFFNTPEEALSHERKLLTLLFEG